MGGVTNTRTVAQGQRCNCSVDFKRRCNCGGTAVSNVVVAQVQRCKCSVTLQRLDNRRCTAVSNGAVRAGTACMCNPLSPLPEQCISGRGKVCSCWEDVAAVARLRIRQAPLQTRPPTIAADTPAAAMVAGTTSYYHSAFRPASFVSLLKRECPKHAASKRAAGYLAALSSGYRRAPCSIANGAFRFTIFAFSSRVFSFSFLV